MHCTTLFPELCATSGLSNIEFTAQGTLTLCFDGLHNITACLNAEDNAVLFYGVVGPAAALSQEGVALRLLQCSLLGADTGGGALGLYEPAQTVMLWKRYDDTFASVDALRQALETFLAELVRWKQIWADGTLFASQEVSAQALGHTQSQTGDHGTGQNGPLPSSVPSTCSTSHTPIDNLPQFGLRV